jgi:hypothetical protein
MIKQRKFPLFFQSSRRLLAISISNVICAAEPGYNAYTQNHEKPVYLWNINLAMVFPGSVDHSDTRETTKGHGTSDHREGG